MKQLRLAKKIKSDYWSGYRLTNRPEFIRQFSESLGYSNFVKPNFSEVEREIILLTDELKIERIAYFNRFNFLNIVIVGTPFKELNGIIIAVHGRNSSPVNMFKIAPEDYNSSIALKWLKKSYVVYSPLVHPDQGPNPNSTYGLDTSNIIDIADHIKKIYLGKIVAIHGLSYGAEPAENIGVIPDFVDCVVSSGGSARGDIMMRAKNKITLVGKDISEHWSPMRSLLYNGASKYKLILPKPLVISIGIKDHHKPKLLILQDIKQQYEIYGKKRYTSNKSSFGRSYRRF